MSRRRRASRPRRLLALLLAAALALGPSAGPALAGARAHVSFTDAQGLFMCTVCHEALGVARSPEAYEENAVLRSLIARGETVSQIKRDMVTEYGTAVLAEPPDHGFGSLVYIVPAAVVAVGVAILLLVLPQWRRRTRDRSDVPATTPGPRLSDADTARLDAELARDP